METLKGTIGDIRTFLYGGLVTLPLTLAGTLLVLGLCTANYAILFFLIGYLILVPIISVGLDTVLSNIFAGAQFNPFKAKTGDICNLAIPFVTHKNTNSMPQDTTVISSTWVAMISFFIGYILTNALQLYNRQEEETTLNVQTSTASDISSKVTNRKSQALLSIVTIIVFGLVILRYRYYSGCESILGMIITTSLFVAGGIGWYYALSGVGQDRLSDLFGIANRLLPASAIANAPIACIPIRS